MGVPVGVPMGVPMGVPVGVPVGACPAVSDHEHSPGSQRGHGGVTRFTLK